jgi:hypothetical protein
MPANGQHGSNQVTRLVVLRDKVWNINTKKVRYLNALAKLVWVVDDVAFKPQGDPMERSALP